MGQPRLLRVEPDRFFATEHSVQFAFNSLDHAIGQICVVFTNEVTGGNRGAEMP